MKVKIMTTKRLKRWEDAPKVEWDGNSPIILNGDVYMDGEELRDELEQELGENEEVDVACLQAWIAEPVLLPYVRIGYFSEEMHEEWDCPKEILEALIALNTAVNKINDSGNTGTWTESKTAAIITRDLLYDDSEGART